MDWWQQKVQKVRAALINLSMSVAPISASSWCVQSGSCTWLVIFGHICASLLSLSVLSQFWVLINDILTLNFHPSPLLISFLLGFSFRTFRLKGERQSIASMHQLRLVRHAFCFDICCYFPVGFLIGLHGLDWPIQLLFHSCDSPMLDRAVLELTRRSQDTRKASICFKYCKNL